jgi:hypothetical protein
MDRISVLLDRAVEQVAERPAAAERADLDIMASFLGMLLDGEGDEEGERWTAGLSELKSRGLVRQTRSGRPMPTAKGRALWSHARSVRARALLGERPDAGRPFFVVFGWRGGGLAFRDWVSASYHAHALVKQGFAPHGGIGAPEDLIEIWPSLHLPPDVARRASNEGSAVLEEGSP